MKKSIYVLIARALVIASLVVVMVNSCSRNSNPIIVPATFSFTFEDTERNWQAFFSDYPVGEETFYELQFQRTNLPDPLDNNVKALKISGNNHSDDLFSCIYRKFDDLVPNHVYDVVFNIELASNVTIGGVGVGGDPNLALGVGGINYQPQNTPDFGTFYGPNFDSMLQAGESNEVFTVVGNIGVSTDFPASYQLVNRNNSDNPIRLKTNNSGELWLMIATDSGFEATTTLYYKAIDITFQ